jgi:hypothetical protein
MDLLSTKTRHTGNKISMLPLSDKVAARDHESRLVPTLQV